MDSLAVSSDNSNILLYSKERHIISHVYRLKHEPSEQVIEDWLDLKIPSEYKGKRVLNLYLKTNLKEHNTLMILFEGGIIASAVIENFHNEVHHDDYFESLAFREEDSYYDMLVPAFCAFLATAFIFFKRRMTQNINN
jgi:hypothetical protein